MKIKNLLAVSMMLTAVGVNAQVYENEMTQAEVESDCYIEGGSALFNDEGTVFYDDASYVQKGSNTTPTSFIFNRDICGNKYLTGFRINMMFPSDRGDIENFVKIEYSTDEETYLEIPEMKAEKSYDSEKGGAYWMDIWYQAALPAGTKEIKVTLLAFEESANWIPCYRYTKLFYEGGTAYSYEQPTYLMVLASEFAVDFESDNYSAEINGHNSTSTIEVVDNPLKDACNGSDKVLKIVQDPEGTEWAWGNADWFGVAIALKDGEDNQLTEITENGRYLHYSVLRAENSTFGMETWGGDCAYKDQTIPFTGKDVWQDMVVDLNEFIGKTFKQFYFSPNEKYGTDNVQVAEVTYIDNIRLSNEATSGISAIETADNAKVWGAEGVINIVAEDAEAVVYTIAGTMVGRYNVNGNIQVSAGAGIYFVAVGETVVKVVVR